MLAAARAVVEATPDYRADNARDCLTGPPASELYTDHPVGNPNPTFADVGAEARVPSESEDNVYVPMTTATDRLDDLRAERANLEAALTSARAAAHRLVETVDNGELPAAPDIDAITALRDTLERLAAALPLEGVTAPSITTIEAAFTALEQQALQTSVRARLEALRALDGGPTLADPLAALCSLVDDTLTHLPDQDVANTVAGLTALADLADLIATDGPTHADPQRLMDLQMRCAAVLPAQLALLPVAVLTGQLRWAASAENTETEADDADPVSVPEATGIGPKLTVPGKHGLSDAPDPDVADMPRPQDSVPSEADTDDGISRASPAPADSALPVTATAATAALSESAPTHSVMHVPDRAGISAARHRHELGRHRQRPHRKPSLRPSRRSCRASRDGRAPADGPEAVRARQRRPRRDRAVCEQATTGATDPRP